MGVTIWYSVPQLCRGYTTVESTEVGFSLMATKEMGLLAFTTTAFSKVLLPTISAWGGIFTRTVCPVVTCTVILKPGFFMEIVMDVKGE